MAQQGATAVPPTNGVLTAPIGRGVVGGNRKKQKRRAKQMAARQASDQDIDTIPAAQDGHAHHPHDQMQMPYGTAPPTMQQPSHEYEHARYPPQEPYDPNGEYFSDEDDDLGYDDDDDPNGMYSDAHMSAPVRKNKRKNKKRRSTQQDYGAFAHEPSAIFDTAMSQLPLPSRPPPPISSNALRSAQRSTKQDRIWNTSTQEERERIKEFWLSLSEDERKKLLRIEKEAVLRKMKEQQKHSCSCTVCGRKRTAIEEELEVLYDAYYEELEQYANHQHPEGEALPPRPRPALPPPASRGYNYPRPLNTGQPHHRTSRVQEIMDDGDEEFSDEEEGEDDEEYSDGEEDIYSSDEYEEDAPRGIGAGFFDFGNSLTVKGGILTVADDLLKNDGKKFIEMMEQLAERRMQREQEAEYAAQQDPHMQSNGQHPLEEDDYEDEDDYDSQEEDDYDEEEEDEMGGMTEEQRMEEGRRMFQIFAARMFEQRVLTAYREKVAAERQQKLLEELEEDEKMGAQREAKKARDAEKKKSKKMAQKQAKAEEKAKKDAEKAAEEAKAKEAEERKQEEARQRREEQRKKKEAEKKAQEDERQRKEAERLRRQQEERDRQQEAERKLREQKALEKRQKDEARKKEREDREIKEKELRDKKQQEEQAKKDRDAKVKADKERKPQQAVPTPQHPQIVRRPTQAGVVAVPPALHAQKSQTGMASPHVAVATPAVPKSATPARPRQSSYLDSHTSSPKVPSLSTGPSKSTSPSSADQQSTVTPKTILQNPQKQQQQQQQPSLPSHQNTNHQGLPPSMHHQFSNGFPNMGFPPYQGQFAPGMHQRQQPPAFPQPGPIGAQYRSFPPSNAPPGMNGYGAMPPGRGFPGDAPPGFQHQLPPIGIPAAPGFSVTHSTMPSHSRQHSTSERLDVEVAPPASTQPISRPAPIQRPASVKPTELGGKRDRGDVDDLSRHLGSSALLDDADDPLPVSGDTRRASNPLGPPRSMAIGSPMFQTAPGSGRLDAFGTPTSNWSSPSTFGPPGINTQGWGPSLNSASWSSGAFGSLGSAPRQSNANRPLAIRLAVCQACRQLSASTNDAYHDVNNLLHQMNRNGSLLDNPPNLKEIEDICETEGDGQNGGGTLLVRRSGSSNFAVRFDPDDSTPSTGRAPVGSLGEIGSPVPSSAAPAFGDRGFGSIAGISSSSGF